MINNKYQNLLYSRIEKTFSEWDKKEAISEKELYEFLHKLKGTSGTIGLEMLSAFCSSQLGILSEENDNLIPTSTLGKFKNRIRQFLEGIVEVNEAIQKENTIQKFENEVLVLIIDDDMEFVSYVKDLLGNMGAQVAIALNGKRGLEMFYSMRPNIILLDLHLPDMGGFEILDQIADIARSRHVPIAIMSVDDNRENRIKSYERGAMDFITKPLDTAIFISYLFNREATRKLIGESVVTDSLTGVGNRRHFDEMLHYFSENANRTESEFTLVMIDIDYFKKVNDRFGHPAGDEVLRKFGEIFMEMKRATDHVFRYGGEEFALLVTGGCPEDASILVERIRSKFNELIFQEGDQSFSVQFSAGIASYQGDTKQLVSSADQALYSAKRTGRNKTVIYQSEVAIIKRKLHIVIVDDDSLLRRMLFEKVSEWKLSDVDVIVHAFSNGPAFLETDWYSPEENFIILLDGIMPEMDGLEVLGRLKNEYNESNVTVAMMTARTGESDIKAALWLGADDYIMKPFKPSEALARIQQLSNKYFI